MFTEFRTFLYADQSESSLFYCAVGLYRVELWLVAKTESYCLFRYTFFPICSPYLWGYPKTKTHLLVVASIIYRVKNAVSVQSPYCCHCTESRIMSVHRVQNVVTIQSSDWCLSTESILLSVYRDQLFV